MDSILTNMDLDQTLAMLEGTLAELRDCQARLQTSEAQLDEMNKLVFEQSATDALTGLKNRAAYERIMNQQSARTGRSRVPLSVLSLGSNCAMASISSASPGCCSSRSRRIIEAS